MLGHFPIPYQDELLYSVIARYRVHLGLESPKHLLDELYQSRGVVAVVDLPGHLNTLKESINRFWNFTTKELIYQRTLFPIYAPFIPEERKQLIVNAMESSSGEGIHMQAGVAASILQTPEYLRYCPLCFQQMKAEHGEYCWQRLFQVTGVELCPKHHCLLLSSSVPFRGIHRHEYSAALHHNCDVNNITEQNEYKLTAIAKSIESILSLVLTKESPSYWQWTHFYHQLATENQYTAGQKVLHNEIKIKFMQCWSESWLHNYHLDNLDLDTSWLRSIFRKHRKSFSYLQHLLLWHAFRPEDITVNLIEEALSYPKSKIFVAKPVVVEVLPAEIARYRAQWISILDQYGHEGIKLCRLKYGGSAIYAWLYRQDKQWLLDTNLLYNLSRDNNRIIDWKKRDKIIVKRLLIINYQYSEELGVVRHSRNWFLKQLPHSYSIEHQLNELPLCHAFFVRYCESITEYQIRRCTLQLINDKKLGLITRRWELERKAGLARERLPSLTELFLQWIESQYFEKNTL